MARYRVPFTIRGEAIVELDPAKCAAYPEWHAKGYVEGCFSPSAAFFSSEYAHAIIETRNVRLVTDDADELP